MKLFISWSGERSRLLAEALRQWLPLLINAVEPWISSSDIDPGNRWSNSIASELEVTRYGIVCLTADNLYAPWILFEAGALSKYVEKSRVVPLLLDVKASDIQGPLSQFQGIQADEDGILRLVKGVNLTVQASNEKGISQEYVDETFKMWWPKLQLSIENIPQSLAKEKRRERTEREMIEELLLLVRRVNTKLADRPLPVPIKASDFAYIRSADVPPPPENFPDDWEAQWQPAFDEAVASTTLEEIKKTRRPGK